MILVCKKDVISYKNYKEFLEVSEVLLSKNSPHWKSLLEQTRNDYKKRSHLTTSSSITEFVQKKVSEIEEELQSDASSSKCQLVAQVTEKLVEEINKGIKKFDIKKLNGKFLLYKMKPPSSYKQYDTLTIAKKFCEVFAN